MVESAAEFCECSARLPTPYGTYTWHVYRPAGAQEDVMVLTIGDLSGEPAVLVRIHSGCVTGDIFGSLRCDCGPQKDLALRHIGEEGRGVFIYLPEQEGRGIGAHAKLHAYQMQEEGCIDTFEANRRLGLPEDCRDYAPAGRIIRHFGLERVRLLTNNPEKVFALRRQRFAVSQITLEIPANLVNAGYLAAKRKRARERGLEVACVPPSTSRKEPVLR